MAAARSRARRRGLTLVELVVVMVILIALAGIILPQLPNMLGRAHTATSATNLGEVNKWVTTYHALYLRFPDQLDSLMAGAGPAAYLPMDPATPYLTPYALVAADAAKLKDAGITQLATMMAAPAAPAKWTPTFNPYNDTGIPATFTAVATGANVLQLPNGMVNEKLGAPLDAANIYVVFGLGKASTLIGKGIFEAPVHFEDGSDLNPGVRYQRFGLIFRLHAALEKAEYVGAVSFHPQEIVSAADEIGEYYNLTK